MLYFIAIVTPDEINEQCLLWKNYMLRQYGCKVALRSPAHITLIPPFSMKPEKEKGLQQLMDQFAKGQQPFPVHVKDFGAFAPKVIYLDVESNDPLNECRMALEKVLIDKGGFGIKKEDRPFHPHITIANRDLDKKDFRLAWEHFKELHYKAGFTAADICLLRHNGNAWDIYSRSVFGPV